VIASDDNASKYLIVPYYKDGKLPFVFCGVNWDASGYGFPAANVTGMIEVQLIDQIIDTLQNYSAGQRVAFIKGDDLSARKEADFFEKRFATQLDKRFVADFSTWKTEYLALQKEADMILLGNSASIKGWNAEEALALILTATTVPTGNWDAWMAPYSLLTLANKPEEQGRWAAATALQILSGTAAGDIPVTINQKGKVYLNMELAKKLGIKFPIELIERATFTSELGL
jgi:ABC transporter substrate binding protein